MTLRVTVHLVSTFLNTEEIYSQLPNCERTYSLVELKALDA